MIIHKYLIHLFVLVIALSIASSAAIAQPQQYLNQQGEGFGGNMPPRMRQAQQMGQGERFGQFQNRRGNRMSGKKGNNKHEGRVKRLESFLKFMNSYIESVKDPSQAIGLAVMSTVETYKRQKKPLEAVPVLNGMLKETKNRKIRNILLFSIQKIYEGSKQTDKVLEINKQIIKENMASIGKSS